MDRWARSAEWNSLLAPKYARDGPDEWSMCPMAVSGTQCDVMGYIDLLVDTYPWPKSVHKAMRPYTALRMILEGVEPLGEMDALEECVNECAMLTEDGCCFIEQKDHYFICEFYYPLEVGPITTTTIDKDHVYSTHCVAPEGATPARLSNKRARSGDVTEHSALYKAVVNDASPQLMGR